MENKFDINSEEVKRILSLHEDATKNQYLNVISEIGAGGEGDTNFFNPKPTTNNPQSSQNKTIKYDVGVYTGQLKNNKPEGKGIMKYENGEIYSGYWKNGVREGKGTLKSPDDSVNAGSYYVGDWRKDAKTGKGMYKYTANGAYYTGDFNNEYRDGKGTYQNKFNVKFYGDWEEDQFICNGKKVETYNLDKLKTNTCNTNVKTNKQQGQPQQKTQPVQQQFVQQVTTNNKLIQTSLGVQQPTGQLTTADIDAIITKLG
jgi:hypothetical protein